MSLAAPLGRFIPIDGADTVHTMFCIDVDTVGHWLWYYTVWYRDSTGLMADMHHWPGEGVASYDVEAKRLLGREVDL